MRAASLLLLLMLLLAAALPVQAQFAPREDARPPVPTWGRHVGASALGAALLGGLGLAVGEIDVTGLNAREPGAYRRPDAERTTVQGLAMLGTMGGALLGASVVGSNTGDATPYVIGGLGAGIGGLMGYGLGALISDADGTKGAGLFAGSVLGAATGAFVMRAHAARRAGLHVSVAPVVGTGGFRGARLFVAF